MSYMGVAKSVAVVLSLLAIVDLLFFVGMFKLLHPFEKVLGTVVSVAQETHEQRVSKSGSDGALKEHRLRKSVTYRFELHGRQLTGNTYYLLEGPIWSRGSLDTQTDFDSLPPDGIQPGQSILVHASDKDGIRSYVKVGWRAALYSTREWVLVYIGAIGFAWLFKFVIDNLFRKAVRP